jgi:transcription elongation factor GreA
MFNLIGKLMKKKVLLTKEKVEALQKELSELENKRKPEISAYLEHARQSDLSEDTDDLSVMLEEKEVVEDRMDEIKALLSNVEIIEKDRCTPSVIQIGSEITIEINGKKQEVKIVSSLEADPLKGYISDKSPLGKALIKSALGKTIKVKVNGKALEYKILKVC